MKIKPLNGRFKQIIALGNTKGNGAFRKQFVVKLIISVERESSKRFLSSTVNR